MIKKLMGRASALVLLAGCAAELGDEGAGEVEGVEQAIEVGSNDVSNPTTNAVVLLGMGCTGTLVAPNLVVTAAHCGFDVREYQDGLWHNLPSAVSVNFGPSRSAPIYSARATRISAPPYAPTPWPEDIVLLQLSTNIPSSIAVPRAIVLDRPATLGGTIYQVGYGGFRDRRLMTGRGYRDVATDPDLPVNGFAYTADYRGPGVGDRDTNIEGGDSGGPMLLGSATGPVIGVLSHWNPYGIATFGAGTGGGCTTSCTSPNRPSIRNWLQANVPQFSDLSVASLVADGCTLSGSQKVKVRVLNGGARSAYGRVDLFANRTSVPPLGTLASTAFRYTSVVPGELKEVSISLPAGSGSRRLDALVDSERAIAESNELNNSFFSTLSLPACTARPAATQLRYTFENGADDARGGHATQGTLLLRDGTRLTSAGFDGGAGWPAYSTKNVTWNLPRAVTLDDIVSVGFTFEDGDCFACTGDNWRIDRVTVAVSQPTTSAVTLATGEGISFHMRGRWDWTLR